MCKLQRLLLIRYNPGLFWIKKSLNPNGLRQYRYLSFLTLKKNVRSVLCVLLVRDDGGWAEVKERAFFISGGRQPHLIRRFSSVEFACNFQNLFQRDATDQQYVSDSCIGGMNIGICNGHEEFWGAICYQFTWCYIALSLKHRKSSVYYLF